MDNRDKLGILFTFARHEQFFWCIVDDGLSSLKVILLLARKAAMYVC